MRQTAGIGPSSAARAALATVLVVSTTLGAAAQQERPNRIFSGRAQVTAVDLVVSVEDADGKVPADLGVGDFTVIEDGVPRQIVGVEPFGRRVVAPLPTRGAGDLKTVRDATPWSWSTVIYMDQVLSSSRSIRRSAAALAAQAGRLTQLGTVEIVTANPEIRQVLRPTRSAQLLEQTLNQMARETVGRDALRQLRRQFVDMTQLSGIRIDRPAQISGKIREEEVLIRRQHDVLLSWLSGYLGPAPRALLLVNDGYDLDPREFYFTMMTDGTVTSQLTGDMVTGTAVTVRSLAKTLAGSGWVTVNLALSAVESAGAVEAEMTGRGRLGEQHVIGGGDAFAAQPDAIVLRPLDPLKEIAIATGGETLTAVNKLPSALERLEEKVRITYQVERAPDGKQHHVEVVSRRPGLKVASPAWSGSGPPEGVASARARQLLAGDVNRGDLPLVAAVALDEAPVGKDGKRHGTLQARLDLGPLKSSLARTAPSNLRVTVAVSFADAEPFVHSEMVQAQALDGLDGWTYKTPVALPQQVDKVAVVVEEMTTSGWGGTLAALVSGPLPAAVTASTGRMGGAEAGGEAVAGNAALVPADLLPDRKPLLLLAPPGDVLVGKVRLESIVSDPRVARVDFLLDGKPVASRDRPPFEARVDFGSLPEPRTAEAVGYDFQGAEVGRDALTVNAGQGSFKVRIIEPRPGDRIGAVDVEAEVKLPNDAALDRVEVFWNGTKTATLFQPPFRTRVLVPPDAPTGYLTVQALRRDGAIAEDVVLLNGTGGSERVDVRLVELPTVVTDPESHPVRDLPKADFRVFEEGKPQTLSDFRDADEAPMNLALLIDTSGSMYPVLDQVKTAAVDFLVLALREQDRALLLDFASKPRLVQPLTGDVGALVKGISGLTAAGGSALCDAVVYSLVEMQQLRGRRALVVLTDGVGRDERVSFDTCVRMVEHTGVPIYAILLAGDDPTAKQGGVSSETLKRLVAPVGGRLFIADRASSLGAAYRSILEELHSQYLLAYYPHAQFDDEGWRRVAVQVERPGLEARTISGYYP